MSFFDFFKLPDINQELLAFHNTKEGVLLDVRTPEEYKEGHIPGSKNVPLRSLYEGTPATQLQTPVFVYCHSGARSRQAVILLKKMGYTNVKNIGGIASYTGKVEK